MVSFNTTDVVEASIAEVLKTLVEAIVLVVLVIFVFLQTWRSTLIPAITIPVSLIGAFAFVKLMGFSINTLTLFGIILATGIVVDDAIVVIENIERHIQEYKVSARKAASDAMREVLGAVVATGLVLVAVFVPVAFFPGTTGRMYAQFSITIAFAVALSVFNAVTLTPALSALLLDRTSHHKSRFFAPFERIIDLGTRFYVAVLRVCLRWRWAVVAGLCRHARVDVVGLSHGAAGLHPGGGPGLLPHPGPGSAGRVARVHRTDREAGRGHHPQGSRRDGALLGHGVQLQRRGLEPGADVRPAQAVRGSDRRRALRPGGARADQRPALRHSRRHRRRVHAARDSGPEPVRRLRVPGPRSEWRRHHAPGAGDAGDRLAGNQSPKLRPGLFSPFTANDPQLQVTIDRERALALGLPLGEITSALQIFLGSQYVNDFEFNNRAYRVYVQADQNFRSNPQALRQLYARTRTGNMVPLEQVVRMQETTAPQVINHFNLFRSAAINGSAAQGVSSGEALSEMERLAAANLPAGMGYAWSGISLEETKAGRQSFLIFGLALLLVYLTLAAQYESLVLPFIVLLGVPVAVLGALVAQWSRGFANDVYCQVGLVMLVGLAAKNAILIVEFAEQLRDRGMSVAEAALEAARIRLRPILMTSLAFILGVLPLVVATGAGQVARRSVGTAVAGGMFLSTFLNLLFIPVLYVVVQTIRARFGAGGRRHAEDAPGPA